MSVTNWSKCPSCHRESELREDYEVYWEDNDLIFDYLGECKCGFKHRVVHKSSPGGLQESLPL